MEKGQQRLTPSQVITHNQSVVGSLLYYARAIDCTMLPAFNEFSKSQANPTQATLDDCQQLLDYANTYRNVSVRYRTSAMILKVETDKEQTSRLLLHRIQPTDTNNVGSKRCYPRRMFHNA